MRRLGIITVMMIAGFACSSDLAKEISQARDLLYNKEYVAADTVLRHVVRKAKSDQGDEKADAAHAEALYQLGLLGGTFLRNYNQAAQDLASLIRRFPQNKRAADATLLLADLREHHLNNRDESMQLRHDFLAQFPNHPKAPEVHLEIIRNTLRLENYEQARTEAANMAQHFKGHALSLEAKFLEATAYAMEGRHTEAVAILNEIRENPANAEIGAQAALEAGNSYLALAEYQMAKEAFTAALDAHPNPLLVRSKLNRISQRVEHSGQVLHTMPDMTRPKIQHLTEHKKVRVKQPSVHTRKDAPTETEAVETAIDTAAGHQADLNTHSDHVLDDLSATTP